MNMRPPARIWLSHKNNLLGLSPNFYNEKELGFHPAMPELKTLFDQGKLATICNVGTLVHPTTKANYEKWCEPSIWIVFPTPTKTKQWQTSVPQTNSPNWLGRPISGHGSIGQYQSGHLHEYLLGGKKTYSNSGSNLPNIVSSRPATEASASGDIMAFPLLTKSEREQSTA